MCGRELFRKVVADGARRGEDLGPGAGHVAVAEAEQGELVGLGEGNVPKGKVLVHVVGALVLPAHLQRMERWRGWGG